MGSEPALQFRDLTIAKAIGDLHAANEETQARLEAVENELRRLSGNIAGLDEFLRLNLLSGSLSRGARSPATAGTTAVQVTKYSAITLGVLGALAQIASAFRPDLQGPLQTLIKLVGGQ